MKECRWAMGLVAIVSLAGCLYDEDDRCDDNMHYEAVVHACVCDANAIASIEGCTPCADDEVISENACVCPDGATKNDDNVCTTVGGSL
ncbi:hypothetical protein BH11MYX2_BH11MYX2_36380 [soil metagenome]